MSNSIVLWQDQTGQNQCSDGECIGKNSLALSNILKDKFLYFLCRKTAHDICTCHSCGYCMSERATWKFQ